MKITIRQWRYIASRLKWYPIDILTAINTSDINYLEGHYIELDLLIRDKLQLSLADLLSESENVLTVAEMSKIIGIERHIFNYRYKINNVKPLTTFPYIHFNQHDIWKLLKRPDIANYFKSNPIYKWRLSNHYSLFEAATKLNITRNQLVILESKGLSPTLFNHLKTKPTKLTTNQNRPPSTQAATNERSPTKTTNSRTTTANNKKTSQSLGERSTVTNKVARLERSISRHLGAQALAQLKRWQRKVIR